MVCVLKSVQVSQDGATRPKETLTVVKARLLWHLLCPDNAFINSLDPWQPVRSSLSPSPTEWGADPGTEVGRATS